MKLILTEKVEKLGQLGDVVKVKGGYARNFLLPQGKAILASKNNLEKFEKERGVREAENIKSRTEALKLSDEIHDINIIIIRSASETGQLYGSVNKRDIAKGVTEKGFNINHQQVVLDLSIKELGLIKVKIKLHPEVIASIILNVARTLEEAEIQEKTGIAVVEKSATEKNNDGFKEDFGVEIENNKSQKKSKSIDENEKVESIENPTEKKENELSAEKSPQENIKEDSEHNKNEKTLKN